MDSSECLLRIKQFVKSSENSLSTSVPTDNTKPSQIKYFGSGLKIKQFYNKLLGDDAFKTKPNSKIKNNEITEHRKPKTPKPPCNINIFMKAVESGIVKDVQAVLEQHPEVLNSQDQFGWTPLMSACCAGNIQMVRQLLQWNPDLNVRDKKGYNCRDLALFKGHQNVVGALDQYKQNLDEPLPRIEQATSTNKSTEVNFFYCKVCKQNIQNTTLKKHLSSTVHNFHASSKLKMATMYGIPESNRGFQILIRSGWDKEGGLGPSGAGHKYPPKTILKHDRTGLGAKQYKARVTHTLTETKHKSKTVSTTKRDLKSEKRKEQRHERDLRRLLS